MKARRKTARKRAAKRAATNYVLRLYVSGQTTRSMRSVETLRTLCEKYLKDRYQLDVIDIFQQPALAVTGQIIAAPTLVKTMPLPLRRLVGDFSDQKRVILGLDLQGEP
jgi:circadian clock protein KaiB